jgi:hypothetical protein
VGIMSDDASALMRRCMDRRFLLADGVFELLLVSRNTMLSCTTTDLVLEGMCMPRLVKSGGAGAGYTLLSCSSSESQLSCFS